MNFSRAIIRRLVALLLLTLLIQLGPRAGATGLEYELRAAFLLNFTRYIEWPRKSGEISICVLGPDVFGPALSDGTAAKIAGTRRIVIRKGVAAVDACHCDVAYIALPSIRGIRDVLETLDSSPVLTVGEDADFLRMGGMIAFGPVDGKVRFYINSAAATRARISISSRLLVLGRNPRDEGERRR